MRIKDEYGYFYITDENDKECQAFEHKGEEHPPLILYGFDGKNAKFYVIRECKPRYKRNGTDVNLKPGDKIIIDSDGNVLII